jgi:uncharacterized membrane protein YphA (DoxX/SURF4 family)
MSVTTPRIRAARWPAVRPWLGVAARLGLAAVWLVAGGSKVGDLAASGRAVNAYQVMPYDVATVVGAALPFVELALGVLLLLGLATRLGAGVSAALLVVFIAGIASAWAGAWRSTADASAAAASSPRDRHRATSRRSSGTWDSWRWPDSC